jgi:hypothetical protein
MNDPKRWLDDSGQSAQLRADLQRAADAVPKYDASAGLAALQSAIDHAAPAAAGAAKASLVKLGVAAGAAVTLAGAVIAVVVMHEPASAPRAPRPTEKGAPVSAEAAQAAPAPTREPARAIEPSDEPTPNEQLAAEPDDKPAPHARVAPDGAARREIAQLARIKAVVEHDPRLALKLAHQGHREFSRGFLRPEREGLAIVALYALGRRTEADERARAYLADNPKGVLAERVRALRQVER